MEAKELARLFNECDKVETKPEVPVSNMFHVHFALPVNKIEPILAEVYEETGIGFTSYVRETGRSSCYYEASIGDQYEKVPAERLNRAFHLLNEKLKRVR